MGQGKFYIPALDGIKAFAFMIVFLSYSEYRHFIPGGFGVTICFFLSGYLMTTLLRHEYSRSHTISLKKIYIRRILRIWPTFYFVLILVSLLILLGVLEGNLEWPTVLAQPFHFDYYYEIFNNYEGVAFGRDVYWSHDVEEYFYLVFPFLYLLLVRMKVSPQKQWLVFGDYT